MIKQEKLKLQKMMQWQNIIGISPKTFSCSFCGEKISSNLGFYALTSGGKAFIHIYVCHVCNSPTFFDSDGLQVPRSRFGDDVKDIADPMVESLYEEARGCCQSNSYTAAVLVCRKMKPPPN